MSVIDSDRNRQSRPGPPSASNIWEIAFHIQIAIVLIAIAGLVFYASVIQGLGQQLIPQPWPFVIGTLSAATFIYVAIRVARRGLWLCGIGSPCAVIIAPPSRIKCGMAGLGLTAISVGIAYDQMGKSPAVAILMMLAAAFFLSISVCGYLWKRGVATAG